MLRRKLDEAWTDKHGNVTRKLVVEATWVQRRKTTSVGQTKVSVEDCNKEDGTEKHRLYPASCWKEIRSQIPEK